MKIMVIGVARSKTTILVEKLKLKYPSLKCLYEYITYELSRNVPFTSICQQLNTQDNIIVKLLSHNLFNNFENVSLLHLNTYDKIYLIERPDFFNQCCSLQICSDTKIFHNRNNSIKYKELGKKTYILLKETILYQAKSVEIYLKIKKYLIDNNIKFTLHDYNDSSFSMVPKIILQKSNLNYANIICNYHWKKDVDELFNTHFNYEKLKFNYISFLNDLENFIGAATLNRTESFGSSDQCTHQLYHSGKTV